ncbi:MAG: hypothetical protein EXR77_19805 [Myxococcales bacterium]|nr:hypothetical protein [Myxococcales bacterium]
MDGSAKRWMVAAAVAGALLGVVAGGGLAGAFTPTGPAVGTGSFPGILITATCPALPAGQPFSVVDAYTVPPGVVFVLETDEPQGYGIRAKITTDALGWSTSGQGPQNVGLLADGRVYRLGAVGPGTKVQVLCLWKGGEAVTSHKVHIRGFLERS